jgi:hypothetical protein
VIKNRLFKEKMPCRNQSDRKTQLFLQVLKLDSAHLKTLDGNRAVFIKETSRFRMKTRGDGSNKKGAVAEENRRPIPEAMEIQASSKDCAGGFKRME